MATVGYGDYLPQMGGGRLIIFFCMFAGLMSFAMPLAIVGRHARMRARSLAYVCTRAARAMIRSNFQTEWERRWLTLISDNVKKWLLLNGMDVFSVFKVFEEFDPDKDGAISYSEYKSTLAAMGIDLDAHRLKAVSKMIDGDKSGEIDYIEFGAALFKGRA